MTPYQQMLNSLISTRNLVGDIMDKLIADHKMPDNFDLEDLHQKMDKMVDELKEIKDFEYDDNEINC
jgi:hypothetical protein